MAIYRACGNPLLSDFVTGPLHLYDGLPAQRHVTAGSNRSELQGSQRHRRRLEAA
ncbi:hypothetical protein F2981_24025 (plasmid) [Sinorhizobium meliloti]|nr:hypothetical protein [Sinorhizobium meliloti]